jgi:hypothetical protein
VSAFARKIERTFYLSNKSIKLQTPESCMEVFNLLTDIFTQLDSRKKSSSFLTKRHGLPIKDRAFYKPGNPLHKPQPGKLGLATPLKRSATNILRTYVKHWIFQKAPSLLRGNIPHKKEAQKMARKLIYCLIVMTA